MAKTNTRYKSGPQAGDADPSIVSQDRVKQLVAEFYEYQASQNVLNPASGSVQSEGLVAVLDQPPQPTNLTNEPDDISLIADYLAPYLQRNPSLTYDPLIDPVEWVHKRLKHHTTPYQELIIRAPFEHRRTAVCASQDLGKSYSIADAALAYFYAFEDAIVITTAPTFRQVETILWGYIRQTHSTRELPGELLRMQVRNGELHYMLGFATSIPENFQGIHSPHILVIVDEASGLNPVLEEAIEGMLTNAGAHLVLVGNPTKLSGMFFEAFHSQKALYNKIELSSYDSPNFTLDGRYNSAIPITSRPDPNAWYNTLASPEWLEERKIAWGEESPMFQVRCLGKFPDQDEFGLIPMSQLELASRCYHIDPTPDGSPVRPFAVANQNHPQINTDVAVGVDIATAGSNESVMYLRRGHHIIKMWTWFHKDTMESCGLIQRYLSDPDLHLVTSASVADRQANHPTTNWLIDAIQIDANGVGKGCYDRLKELGLPVRDFNSANKPTNGDDYFDKRAEAFWNLRVLFERGLICNLTDDKTKSQLSTLIWELLSNNKVRIKSKQKMAANGLVSPDRADALAMCFYPAKGLAGQANVVLRLPANQQVTTPDQAVESDLAKQLLEDYQTYVINPEIKPRIELSSAPTRHNSFTASTSRGSRWRR